MKILYAASNNANAKIQVSRFLQAMQGSKHQLKVAAYKQSSPKGINIDWTLDCLLNLYQPDLISLYNDNLQIYFEQVKSWGPDLVISDLEYFTSYIAQILNITIWQCSSSLINFALERNEKYSLGLYKHYAFAIDRGQQQRQRIINLLDNSNGNFVYSHFGDTVEQPQLKTGFEWVRPYHQIGKTTIPCQHHVVAGLSNKDKRVLGWLSRYSDVVVFIDFRGEIYQNVQVKDIENQEEYFCNIKNSPIFVCRGQISFLADAFYNGKYCLIYPDYHDAETILNSYVSQYLKLGHIIDLTENPDNYLSQTVFPLYDGKIKYLHEKVSEL
jgi:uncharacterized protein (TIGR00661 family)